VAVARIYKHVRNKPLAKIKNTMNAIIDNQHVDKSVLRIK